MAASPTTAALFGFSRHALLTTACLFAACSGSPSAKPSDHLHERITVVEPQQDGTMRIGFELSQRWFVIDPVLSPDAKAMAAFAASAKAAGRPVHATVAPSGDRVKGDDGPAFVLVRLADTPGSTR